MLNMNSNPMEVIQLIRNGQNPQQIVMSMLQGQMGNTPMGANLLSLAQQGKTQDIEKIARNLAQQKGLDFDKEFADFKNKLGLK